MTSETNELIKFFNLDIFSIFFFFSTNFYVSIFLYLFKVIIKIIQIYFFCLKINIRNHKIILKKLRFIHYSATWISF